MSKNNKRHIKTTRKRIAKQRNQNSSARVVVTGMAALEEKKQVAKKWCEHKLKWT